MAVRHYSYGRQAEELFDRDLVGILHRQHHQADIQSAIAEQSHLFFTRQPVEGDFRLPVAFHKNMSQ